MQLLNYPPRRIRLLVADDDPLVRQQLIAQLSGTEISILAETHCGSQVLPLALEHKPDVILLDVHMPTMDGLATLSQLAEAAIKVPVLMFATGGYPAYLAFAKALGACGYILKGSDAREVISAIRAAGTQRWLGWRAVGDS